MSRFSIVVPAYNQERYLSAALESARAALSGLRGNIVVVDDGSNDGTAALIASWRSGKSDVVALRHSRNRGKLAALNTAAEAADGDYIVVLDADDTMNDSYLSRAYEAICSTGVDFVYTGCNLIDENGAVIGFGRSLPFRAGLIEEYSFIPDCAFTTRECFRSVLPLDESVRVLPKHYRWQQICRLGYTGLYLEDPLLNYRMHQGNMSGIGRRIIDDIRAGHHDHHLLTGYWAARTSCHGGDEPAGIRPSSS